jgi:poly(A) polymerase
MVEESTPNREPATPAAAEAAATKIVRMLRDRGHAAYFAGGCVRDRIMGRSPSDYDVATDAPPDRVQALFHVTRAVGQAFGVVMVRMSGVWIETATFRTESGYADHRHPDQIAFSDAEHDARRRDFTINGLFYDPVDQRVIDYVGGQADIAGRTIRAIGDPPARFEEDYLRMLRAARFAARLGFAIEPATASAIRMHAPRLSAISRERIGLEIRMMLEHPGRAVAVALLQELGLDVSVLMEPATVRPCAILADLPPDADYAQALAAWAIDRHAESARHDSASALATMKIAQIARRWRQALVLSNEHHHGMLEILTALREALRWPQLTVARRKRLMGRSDWPGIQSVWRALAGAHGGFDLPMLQREFDLLREQGVSPAPWVTGDDLTLAGFPPGPRFKHTLDAVYDAQLEGRVGDKSAAMVLADRLMRQAD